MLSNSANTVCFTMAKLSRSSGLTGSEGGASICNGLIGCPFLYTGNRGEALSKALSSQRSR